MASHTVGTVESLQLAIEAAPTGVLIVEPTGKIVVVNRELERQLGYARAELVGECVDVLMPELLKPCQAIQPQAVASIPEIRRLGGAGGDLFVRQKDRTLVPVEIGLNPIQTPNGLLILVSVVVTALRQLDDGHRVEHEERLAFERLVAELSSQFISLEPDSINISIRDALRRTCELLGLDRGTFVRIADGEAVHSESWAAPGVSSTVAWVHATRPFPWMTERLLAGEAVSFSTIDGIPSEIDRQACRAFDTRSGLLFPLRVDE